MAVSCLDRLEQLRDRLPLVAAGFEVGFKLKRHRVNLAQHGQQRRLMWAAVRGITFQKSKTSRNIAVQPMPSESGTSVRLQIGHILFMDLVAYSTQLLDEQRQYQEQLTEIVRATEQVRSAKEAGKLIRLPAGDGMALVFFDSLEAPVRCAIEISKKLKEYPQLKLRMGIH